MRKAFRGILERWLDERPRPTPDGGIVHALRTIEFGFRGGSHGEIPCWVYRHRDDAVEMLFAFYANFTADDLICKVVPSGETVSAGTGASIQFNADECVHAKRGKQWELVHHGRVTVGRAVSRSRLLTTIAAVAPEGFARFSDASSDRVAWPVILGGTSDLPRLVDRLFAYAYCIEQAKRSIRGEPHLPTIKWAT